MDFLRSGRASRHWPDSASRIARSGELPGVAEGFAAFWAEAQFALVSNKKSATVEILTPLWTDGIGRL